MGDVVTFDGLTTLDIPVENVLTGALEYGKFKEVIVLGWTEDDDFYFATSKTNIGDINLCLDVAKQLMIRQALGED